MRALIWKEWRENLKWVPLPGLVILVVILIDRPLIPMVDVTEAFFFGLTAVAFGAALRSRARGIGWALVGFFFGWVELLVMLAIEEWPARVACPECRKPRVVTCDRCEHCGAPHALPVADGTEIFETTISAPQAALVGD